MALTIHIKSEQQYWNEFRKGSKSAFEWIYKRYFNLLFDYGMRHTQEEEITIDCLQDFFLYLWNHKGNLGDARSVKFYLISSFRRRLFRNLEKERKLRYQREAFYLNMNQEDNSEEMRIILAEDESKKIKLTQCLLMKLSPRQKEVFYLRYFNAMSPQEISETMNLSYQTVVNHLCEGMKSLRKQHSQMKKNFIYS